MDNAAIFALAIVLAIVVGYFAHKKHWKIADIF
jgi:hypothetical protein